MSFLGHLLCDIWSHVWRHITPKLSLNSKPEMPLLASGHIYIYIIHHTINHEIINDQNTVRNLSWYQCL